MSSVQDQLCQTLNMFHKSTVNRSAGNNGFNFLRQRWKLKFSTFSRCWLDCEYHKSKAP